MTQPLSELFIKCTTAPYSEIDNINYALLYDRNVLYVFFEDSDGLADWKSNLDFPAKAYKRMGKTVWFAHRGFLNVWKKLEPILAPKILDKSIKNIIISGYSHGAGIAVLCHEYVWYNRPDLRGSLEGYGFGCPRVFWGIKTKELKIRWQSFTVIRNVNDIVTHLPPAVLGYSHVGNVLEIGTKGKYSPIEAHIAVNILTELKNYEKRLN